MNSGTHGMIPPNEVKPSGPCRCPSWKMSVIRPYAAPTESRFSPIEISGMASERNATMSRIRARPATTANTSGVRECSAALKS